MKDSRNSTFNGHISDGALWRMELLYREFNSDSMQTIFFRTVIIALCVKTVFIMSKCSFHEARL